MLPKRDMGWLLEEKSLVLYMLLCFLYKFLLGVKVGICRHKVFVCLWNVLFASESLGVPSEGPAMYM